MVKDLRARLDRLDRELLEVADASVSLLLDVVVDPSERSAVHPASRAIAGVGPPIDAETEVLANRAVQRMWDAASPFARRLVWAVYALPQPQEVTEGDKE